MKYNKYTLQNENEQYVKYPTAYGFNEEYTNNLDNIHLWDNKEDAQNLANYLKLNHGTTLKVVEV